MDYRKTVHLLETKFPWRAEGPKREPLRLESWKKLGLYKKIQEKQKGKPVFLLHDGPPYANGSIHMGHALNKILKDFVVKFKTLSGFSSPYKPGWDTHGLPIEHQLFKTLKKSKRDVSRVEVREKAAEYALSFVDKQRDDFVRLGVFGEWENPYITLSNDYEAAIVETFFELNEKGFIYRGKKPGYWCAFDETALAEAEVEYADKKSDSVFVRFAVDADSIPDSVKPQLEGKDADVLIWTTTPWTLPANKGLAFHPEEKYGLLKKNGRLLIVAEQLKEKLAKKIDAELVDGPTLRGSDYEGLTAKNPLHGATSIAVTADYVTMEDGSGIVHIAPGHGAEDYAVGLKWRLEVASPVDESGRFDETVGRPDLVGKHVLKDANEAVIQALGDSLVLHYSFKHSYPHCWRCKNPIIFRATEQWFLKVDEPLREKLLQEIDSVKWEPSYGIHRIQGMVQNRPDWCLSRQRHWGAPIAVFYCVDCREPLWNKKVNEKIVDLIKTKGANEYYLRSETELLSGLDASCGKCGKTEFKKEMDILDVWFDSGVSWFSVVEKQLSNPKPLTVMYLEGSDQHRGWFQTSLIPSVCLRDKAPYDVVMTHGFVVDGKGQKMSKSLGNVISPQEIINKYGADILRLWVAASDYREDVRLSPKILDHVIDMYRKYRNVFRFLLQNTSDFKKEKHALELDQLEEIDRWILVYFEEIKSRVLDAYDKFEFHVVLSEMNRFMAVALSGFYLDTIKDWLYCESVDSKKRRSCQTALYHLAKGVALLLSPLVSFTAEEAFLELREASDPQLPESVFLEEEMNLEKLPLDRPLLEKWERILEIRGTFSDGLDALKKAEKIKKSQEAKVVFSMNRLKDAQKKALEDKKLDWPFILQAAEVELAPDGQEAATITPTTLKKCARCWRHRPSVGANAETPDLCARCVGALENVKACRSS